MPTLSRPLGVLTLALFAGPGLAQPTGMLIILDKADNVARFIDMPSGEVRATCATGRGPHEASASPNRLFAVEENRGPIEIDSALAGNVSIGRSLLGPITIASSGGLQGQVVLNAEDAGGVSMTGDNGAIGNGSVEVTAQSSSRALATALTRTNREPSSRRPRRGQTSPATTPWP